jgi:Flp pilus assembly protein TadG
LSSSKTRFRCGRRGVASLEFALILMGLVTIVVCTYDIGGFIQQRVKITEAVRAGGQYAVSFPTDLTGAAAAVTAAMPAGWTDAVVTVPAAVCVCWNSALGEQAGNCATNCPVGMRMRRQVSLSVTRPYAPLAMTMLTQTQASFVARIQ